LTFLTKAGPEDDGLGRGSRMLVGGPSGDREYFSDRFEQRFPERCSRLVSYEPWFESMLGAKVLKHLQPQVSQ